MALSDEAGVWMLAERLRRPPNLIGSSEFTTYRALNAIEYAQRKILEARQARQTSRGGRGKGRR